MFLFAPRERAGQPAGEDNDSARFVSPPERASGGPMNVVSLWKPVESHTEDSVRPQQQNLSLRIIVARNLAGHYPFSVDKVSLLHISESNILWPVGVWGEVDSHATTDKVILVGTGRDEDGSCFERRLGGGCHCRKLRRSGNLPLQWRSNVRTAARVGECQCVVAQLDLFRRISLVESHSRDGVSALVSQNHGRQLIKKAIYSGKIRWNGPVSVNAERRESDGVVFADSHDCIGGVGARFGDEEGLGVKLDALAEPAKGHG